MDYESYRTAWINRYPFFGIFLKIDYVIYLFFSWQKQPSTSWHQLLEQPVAFFQSLHMEWSHWMKMAKELREHQSVLVSCSPTQLLLDSVLVFSTALSWLALVRFIWPHLTSKWLIWPQNDLVFSGNLWSKANCPSLELRFNHAGSWFRWWSTNWSMVHHPDCW